MVIERADAANCGWIPLDTDTELFKAPDTMISVEPCGVIET